MLVLAIVVAQLSGFSSADQLFLPESLTNLTRLLTGHQDVAALAGDLPPPAPQRPAPSPPEEPVLSLDASASDDQWEKARCKGANFVRAMRGSDQEAGQIFQPPQDTAASDVEFGKIPKHPLFLTLRLTCHVAEDFEDWGWELDYDLFNTNFEHWGVDRIFRELGISDKDSERGGTIHCVTLNHGYDFNSDNEEVDWDETYVYDWTKYRKTGAHYGFGIDPHSGGESWVLTLQLPLAYELCSHHCNGSSLASICGTDADTSCAG